MKCIQYMHTLWIISLFLLILRWSVHTYITFHVTPIFFLFYDKCIFTQTYSCVASFTPWLYFPSLEAIRLNFLSFKLPRQDLPVNRFLDLSGILLWMWELWFRLVKLFEKPRLILGLPFGQPQQAFQVLHFVPQVVVGFLEDFNLLRKCFNLLLFLEESFLHCGAQELWIG